MWNKNTSERLAQWRDFRKKIDHMTIDQAVTETAEFWRSCPFSPYYLDPATPNQWPDPWQLIMENYYCDIAKCLGILYTIYLSMHGEHHDAEIRIYRDADTGLMYNLAVFSQGKYVVNLLDDGIVNINSIPGSLKLLHCYSSRDLRLEQY